MKNPFKTKAASSIGASKPFMPETLGRAYLYTLPCVEILVGLMIVFGWFTRIAGLIASLILISIIMAVTGVRTPPPFNPNVIILGLTLMLMLAGPGGIALDNIRFSRGAKAKSVE